MRKSMIYLQQLLTLCALIVAFAACKEDDNTSGGDITLLSSKEFVYLATDTKVEDISFSATGDWVAVPSKGWLKLNNIQGGAGQQKIALTVATNDTFSQRIGTVSIKDKVSGKMVEVTVTQGAKDAEFVFSTPDGTILGIDNEKREILGTVRIASNYDWSISIPDAEWLTYLVTDKEDNNCTVTFYGEPDKMEDYNARHAEVHFNYISKARTAETKNYRVSFLGIKPIVKFTASNNIEQVIQEAILLDENKEMDYKTTFKVISNRAWDFKQLPDFVDVEILGGNKSEKFFNTETSIVVRLKKGKMDTDGLNGALNVIDASSDEQVANLPVKVLGVGEHAAYIDRAAFPSDQMAGCFMFEAQGADEWSSILKNFIVSTSNQSKLNFYLIKMDDVWRTPCKSGSDEWGEVSNDVTDYWGGVETSETKNRSTRALIKDGEWQLWLKSRNEYEGSLSNYKKERYFALVAVSSDVAPNYDALFDNNGDLKQEFEGNFIVVGQRAKAIKYSFYSEQISEGKVLKVGAAGQKIEIIYESDAENMNMYENVLRFSDDDPFDWNGGEYIDENNEMLKAEFTEPGKIVLTVKPNKTGAKRTTKCGISNYIEGNAVEYLLIAFDIEQAAE